MKEYHKIVTLFKRDPETKFKTVISGDYAMDEFYYLEDCQWTGTEKIDGTNIRVMWDGQKVTFGGKTDNAQIYAPLVTHLQSVFYAGLMETIFGDTPVCVYGEGYGSKIQKAGVNYNADEVGFAIFDVKVGDNWLERNNVEDIANKSSCECAPIVYSGKLAGAVQMVRSGFKSRWGDFISEGLVLRPFVELKTRTGHRIITKLKHRDFSGVK